MEMHHLRSFVAVAELLSFRRAAERLHLSRPPLTRQIKALEEEVGVLLLVRNGRQLVRLTEAGHAFLEHAKQALQKVQAAGDHARWAAEGADGVLRLAGCAVHSPVALNVYLPEFRRRYPAVEVTFTATTRAEELIGLREGSIHLSISADFGETPGPPFKSKVLTELPLALVLPAEHPLARKRSVQVDLQALSEEVFLQSASEEKPVYISHLDEAWIRTVPTKRIVRTVDGLQNVLAMVAAGYGVTILSGRSASTSIPACRVKRLCLPPPSYQLRMLWREDQDSPILHYFLRLTEHLSLSGTDLPIHP